MTRREQLVASLKDEEYRHALVDQHVASVLPFQLRAMREERGWTQQELGDRCGKKQEWISKLENPNYARFTLQTLKTLARAFDVALQVRFVGFGGLIDWFSNRRPGDLRVPSYSEDPFLSENAISKEERSQAFLASVKKQFEQAVPKEPHFRALTGSGSGQIDLEFMRAKLRVVPNQLKRNALPPSQESGACIQLSA